MDNSKICRDCGEATPYDQLTRNHTSPDGFDNLCKACNRKRANAYRNAHIDEVRAKEKIRARNFRKEHPEKEQARARQYRQRHPERVLESRRKWRVAHREAYNAAHRANNMKRYARKQKASGKYTAADVQRQYQRQHGKCYWCNEKLNPDRYQVDHVIPLSRGGSNGPENIVIAHPRCNQSKSDKLPHEWEGNGGKLL